MTLLTQAAPFLC